MNSTSSACDAVAQGNGHTTDFLHSRHPLGHNPAMMGIEVKICGLKTVETLDAAVHFGADYVGLVFFAKSPRNIALPDAAMLATRARGKSKIVGLVVDADNALLDAIMRQVMPDILQLHGEETPDRVHELKKRYGCGIIKAIKVETADDAQSALDYVDAANLILFDAKAPKGAVLPGGNGHVFDWRLLDGVKGRVPFMLSGGLTTGNVSAAIRATGALRVDVSSGVESAPGTKDVAMISSFIVAAKASTHVANMPNIR